MTLKGFEHTQENIDAKKKLDRKVIQQSDLDILDSGRRSRSRNSQNVSEGEGLENPPSDGKLNMSQSLKGNLQVLEFDDVPPMNQEIVSDHSGNDIMASRDDLRVPQGGDRSANVLPA